MRSQKIHTQMVLRVVLTIIVAITIIYTLSYDAIRSVVQQNAHANMLNQVRRAADEVESIIKHHKMTVDTYARVIRGSFNQPDHSKDLHNIVKGFASQPNQLVFGYWFSYHSAYKNQGKKAIWYGYDEKGQFRDLYQDRQQDDSVPYYRDNPHFDYYHGAVKKRDIHITAPYLDPHITEPKISISKPVYDDEEQLIGVAGVDIRFNDLKNIASQLSIHPSSKTLLLTRKGDVLYNPEHSHAYDTNIYRDLDPELARIFTKVKRSKDNVVMMEYQQREMYVYSVCLRESKWSALIMVPVSEVDSVLKRVLGISVAAFFFLVGVIYLFVHLWVRRLITRPLRQLVAASTRIAKGNFKRSVRVSANNEFSMLAEQMNHMLVGLRKQTQLEQEMKRMSALKMVGEMAAAISHEIRNPLTTVSGFLQLLRGKPEHASEHIYFDTMMEEITRANNIITEYLTLAQNKFVQFRMHSLNTIIEQMYPLVQATATAKCQHIELQLRTLPPIPLDEKEIRQLLHNLIRNGLEAMEPGQHLHIRTMESNEWVLLQVEDEGSGFDSAVLRTVGTPFQTTKPDGTGLGLAICFSIVKRHQGKIVIESEFGRTVITVHLPKLRVEATEIDQT
ncbi:sensor histidine kinase [Paenibacillus sp. 481]|uniref:sensor histidine kinase n=1 Tax=Paenibacillus sp. 481 TaxID=2835869 RepID=UPI001E5EF683|nr:sensor histidine kinase [Paenibacillus sp. 481]UHA73600.1 sensor histidine kinase [Paenibacillus sp. 481]